MTEQLSADRRAQIEARLAAATTCTLDVAIMDPELEPGQWFRNNLIDQWREAKLALDTSLETAELRTEQFGRELTDAETHERQLEASIRTFLTVHDTASGRTCQCRLCQQFRDALAGEAASDEQGVGL